MSSFAKRPLSNAPWNWLSCGQKGNPGRASLGSPQPAAQPVELAGEQGEGESEDRAGHFGSRSDLNHALPLHGSRPRRDDRGSGEIPERRGIRIRECPVRIVGEIVGTPKWKHHSPTALE